MLWGLLRIASSRAFSIMGNFLVFPFGQDLLKWSKISMSKFQLHNGGHGYIKNVIWFIKFSIILFILSIIWKLNWRKFYWFRFNSNFYLFCLIVNICSNIIWSFQFRISFRQTKRRTTTCFLFNLLNWCFIWFQNQSRFIIIPLIFNQLNFTFCFLLCFIWFWFVVFHFIKIIEYYIVRNRVLLNDEILIKIIRSLKTTFHFIFVLQFIANFYLLRIVFHSTFFVFFFRFNSA